MKRSWQRREFIKTSALTGLSMGLLGNLSLKAGGANAGFAKPEAGKRIGIIGLDTSHSTAFTKCSIIRVGAIGYFRASAWVAG